MNGTEQMEGGRHIDGLTIFNAAIIVAFVAVIGFGVFKWLA